MRDLMLFLRLPVSAAVLVLLTATLGCTPVPPGSAPSAAVSPPEGTPRLVVVVVSDQFRADYLDRLDGLWSGGVRRLLDEGVSFTAAHHAHAVTKTSPGHASLSTGAYPARHGVVSNEWFDRDLGRAIEAEEDREDGQLSPANLLVPTFADQLKRRYPRARVFAASAKANAALLMAGFLGDGAFWYDDERDPSFVAGEHHDPRGAPDWFDRFAAAGPSEDFFLEPWRPLPVAPERAATAGFHGFSRGPFDRGRFDGPTPARIPGRVLHRRDEYYRGGFAYTPGIDGWLGELAREVVEQESLGADEWPDLLALSFSGVDRVGHTYGPNSLEVLDTLLRLDRTLGELFDFLDERVGAGNYAVAFSSDHGVVPVPEMNELSGETATRAWLDDLACMRRMGERFAAAHGDDVWLGDGWEGLYLDPEVLAGEGVELAAAQRELADAVAACPSVVEAWTLTELTALPAPERRPRPGDDGWHTELQRRSAHPRRSPDVVFRWIEGFNYSLTYRSEHGSPYAYDTHVPFILSVPGLAAATVGEPVETVDLAPTLAALLDVEMGEVDGVDLSGRLRGDS